MKEVGNFFHLLRLVVINILGVGTFVNILVTATVRLALVGFGFALQIQILAKEIRSYKWV